MKKNGAGYYTWYWILLTKIYQKNSSYYKCPVNFAFSYFYFLQNAVNLTSTLVRKASTADSKVNILVSFEKLEVFAMNYASLHLTPQNGSEREISIEQKELGIAFFVTILQIIFASSVCFLVCLFVCFLIFSDTSGLDFMFVSLLGMVDWLLSLICQDYDRSSKMIWCLLPLLFICFFVYYSYWRYVSDESFCWSQKWCRIPVPC